MLLSGPFVCAKLLNRNIGRAKQIVLRKSASWLSFDWQTECLTYWLQLSWQSATVLTVCNCLNRPWIVLFPTCSFKVTRNWCRANSRSEMQAWTFIWQVLVMRRFPFTKADTLQYIDKIYTGRLNKKYYGLALLVTDLLKQLRRAVDSNIFRKFIRDWLSYLQSSRHATCTSATSLCTVPVNIRYLVVNPFFVCYFCGLF